MEINDYIFTSKYINLNMQVQVDIGFEQLVNIAKKLPKRNGKS